MVMFKHTYYVGWRAYNSGWPDDWDWRQKLSLTDSTDMEKKLSPVVQWDTVVPILFLTRWHNRGWCSWHTLCLSRSKSQIPVSITRWPDGWASFSQTWITDLHERDEHTDYYATTRESLTPLAKLIYEEHDHEHHEEVGHCLGQLWFGNSHCAVTFHYSPRLSHTACR